MAQIESISGPGKAQNGPDRPGPAAPPLQRRIWPLGRRQRLSRPLANRLFLLIASGEQSLQGILQDHPELPPHSDLIKWRRLYPWFKAGWQAAREAQAEFLMQRCLDLASDATKENAHAVRVKFDIYKLIAARYSPGVYGDRIQSTPAPNINNTVVLISQDRLSEIRTKLDITRASLATSEASTPALTDKSNVQSTSRSHPESASSARHG